MRIGLGVLFAAGVFSFQVLAENRQDLVERFNEAEERRVESTESVQEGKDRLGLKDPEMGRPQYSLEDRLKNIQLNESKPEDLKREVARLVTPQSPSGASKDFSYFSALKNAIPCFKDFLSNMLQVRAERDGEYVACQVEGETGCESSQILHQAEKENATLADEFKVCLNEDA